MFIGAQAATQDLWSRFTPEELRPEWISGARRVGVTAGASSPEDLTEQLLLRLAERFPIRVETVEHVREDVTFKQPAMMAG